MYDIDNNDNKCFLTNFYTSQHVIFLIFKIMQNLHAMLIEVASTRAFGRTDAPNSLTALSASCLISLSVARGEAELILNAVTSLIMSHPALSDQYIQVKYQSLTKFQT